MTCHTALDRPKNCASRDAVVSSDVEMVSDDGNGCSAAAMRSLMMWKRWRRAKWLRCVVDCALIWSCQSHRRYRPKFHQWHSWSHRWQSRRGTVVVAGANDLINEWHERANEHWKESEGGARKYFQEIMDRNSKAYAALKICIPEKIGGHHWCNIMSLSLLSYACFCNALKNRLEIFA